VAVLAATLALSGCAALPLAVVGGAMLQGGAGAVARTGTEYTLTGAVYRTFTIPSNAVRAAVLLAFERAGVSVSRVVESEDREEIEGQLRHRTVQVRLTPFSESLTGLTLVVKRNPLLRDRATSSELLEQIEQGLAENPAFARRLRRPVDDSVATAPR
jgi:hypothetical protein